MIWSMVGLQSCPNSMATDSCWMKICFISPVFLGVMESPRTCLHAILSLLEQGVEGGHGPRCLHEMPCFAELAYQLIYKLCASRDTSAPTLRYLRTTHDFLYQQLRHLPFIQSDYSEWSVTTCLWLMFMASVLEGGLPCWLTYCRADHWIKVWVYWLENSSDQPAALQQQDGYWKRGLHFSLHKLYAMQTELITFNIYLNFI